MMKKKLFATVLVLTLIVSLFAGCGKEEATEEIKGGTTETTATTETTTDATSNVDISIRLVNGKIEIDQQLKDFATYYKEKTGVEVIIESIGGGADIGATLKGYLAAENMPDLFVLGGEGDYNTWKDYLTDLSSEAWVSDTDVAFVGEDGQVVGFPYAIEGYGITYNKDLLEKAGIDPGTLTSFGAYKDAFEKIDGMKEELGIDAVLSMGASISGGLTWSTGLHNFGSYLATGLDRGDSSLIDGLKEGVTVDRERLDQYASFVDLLFSYSDDYVLKSGSYDEQLALWEDEKTVFIHQGNWIDPNLLTDEITFNVGIAPSAFLVEETDGILADAPSWWGLYKDSKNQQAAKDFLTALATTEEGANCLVAECGMISPFASTTIEPTAPLAKDLMRWVSEGKTYAWQWTKMPDGFGMNTLGPVFEAFATGAVDATGFADMIEAAVSDLQ